MARTRREGVLIAGGGVAGSLAALAMARLRPEVPLLIVEERETFGGDRFHHLFDEEMDAAERVLVDPILEHRWPGFYIAFPSRSRNLKGALAGFGGDALHREMMATLRPDQYRLGARIVAVKSDGLELEGGEMIRAPGVIDARGAANLSMLELLYETRVERIVRLSAPHRLDRPLLVDATGDQSAGFAFVQAFPLDEVTLRIGRALVSERSLVDEAAEGRLDFYLGARGWAVAEEEKRIQSVTPLPYGGDLRSFWRIGGARVAKLGLRGGFVQPASGRTAGDALRNALVLAAQRDFTSEALHDAFEERAQLLWKKRESERALGAALAHSAPEARRARMERLYALDRGLILHFLTDRLGLIERRQVARALK